MHAEQPAPSGSNLHGVRSKLTGRTRTNGCEFRWSLQRFGELARAFLSSNLHGEPSRCIATWMATNSRRPEGRKSVDRQKP
jgi:hypothetical protein